MAERIRYIDNNWDELNQLISNKSYSKIFVLVDSNTHEHCMPILSPELTQAFEIIEIEPGEASKDLEICQHIWHDLTAKEADRKAVIINLGGGVVTDLGGFIASIYKRGIDFINIPTSLLAMVDASSGGKCGIDFMGFKNQLGAFKESEKCFIHSQFLKTLPAEEIKSGYAEMLKHGLIADKLHWKALQENQSIQIRDIENSIAIKAAIVSVDPFEKGDRKKLNFGHTIGHALESFFMAQVKQIPHGFAVAAGILCETYISHKINGLSIEGLGEINGIIQQQYDKLEFLESDIPKIIEFLAQDKKNERGSNRFTLLNEIGSSSIDIKVNSDLIIESLVFYLNTYES